MSNTNKQANANNSRWTPPNVVRKQQQEGSYGFYTKRNCQNNFTDNSYATPPPSTRYHHQDSTNRHYNHNTPKTNSYQESHTTPTKDHSIDTYKKRYTPDTSHQQNSHNDNNDNLNKNNHKNNTYNNFNNSKKITKNTNPTYTERKDDILLPLKTFVESLPPFLQSSTQELALVLLNCTDEYDRRSEMAEFFRRDSSYIPISARIKYKLTSSSLLQHDQIYLENASKCATVVDLAQKLLRRYTFQVVEREVWAARQNLLNKYIEHGLTVTQMILLFEKIQQKHKYGNIPYNDEYLSKVSLYNYIFEDLTNISKYLNCNINELTEILQDRRNLSQDTIQPTYKQTSQTETTTDTQTNTAHNLRNSFDYASDENTEQNPTQQSYTETYATEHAQVPPLPPTPPLEPKNPPSVLHKASINTANININLSTNHHANTTNNTTSNLSTRESSTTIIENSKANKISATTIINPYTKTNKNSHTPRVTPLKPPAKTNVVDTETTNDKDQSQIPSSQSTNSTDQSEHQALEELRKMINNHIKENKTDKNASFTQTSSSSLYSDQQNTSRDITLETFYQHPPAADLTTKVKDELMKILPKLTHNFNSKRKSIECEEEAANAALAWYHKIKTKNATEAVSNAIDQQPTATPTTIQELINDSVNKSISKTSNQIVRTIEKQIRKKSSGPTHDQGQKAKPTYTGQDTKNTTNTKSTNSSIATLESTTSTQPHSQALLKTTQPKTSNLITWDDYLNHKKKKTQRMKWRNQTNNRNARNAKWKKLP